MSRLLLLCHKPNEWSKGSLRNDSSDVFGVELGPTQKKFFRQRGLCFLRLKALPKQYIHPLEERIDEAKVLPQASIAVNDMSKCNDAEVAKSICDATENWGYFQVFIHCVPLEILRRVKAATHRFFGLSAYEKKRYSKEPSPSNSVRFVTSFNTQVEKALQRKDFLSPFYVSYEEASALRPPVCK